MGQSMITELTDKIYTHDICHSKTHYTIISTNRDGEMCEMRFIQVNFLGGSALLSPIASLLNAVDQPLPIPLSPDSSAFPTFMGSALPMRSCGACRSVSG